LLTHNRVDFDRLAAEWVKAGKRHSGIIVAVRRRPFELARRLLQLLNTVSADEMEDQLQYV
jgi:hypothetical protein